MSKTKTETKQETRVHVSNGLDFFAALTWTAGAGAIALEMGGEPSSLTAIEAHELGVALCSAARANGYNTTRAPRKAGA
jgi:hypothetical protein